MYQRKIKTHLNLSTFEQFGDILPQTHAVRVLCRILRHPKHLCHALFILVFEREPEIDIDECASWCNNLKGRLRRFSGGNGIVDNLNGLRGDGFHGGSEREVTINDMRRPERFQQFGIVGRSRSDDGAKAGQFGQLDNYNT